MTTLALNNLLFRTARGESELAEHGSVVVSSLKDFAYHAADLREKPATAQSTLSTGLTVILGGTGSGKSTYIKHLTESLEKDSFRIFRFLETDTAEPSIFAASEWELGRLLVGFADKGISVFIIDSIRDFVFSSNGVLGAGGFNQRIYSNLTLLHELAEQQGISIIVTLNPVDEDLQKMEAVFKNLSSSVDVVWVQSTKMQGDVLRISGVKRIRSERRQNRFGESKISIDYKAESTVPRIVIDEGTVAEVVEISTDLSRSTIKASQIRQVLGQEKKMVRL